MPIERSERKDPQHSMLTTNMAPVRPLRSPSPASSRQSSLELKIDCYTDDLAESVRQVLCPAFSVWHRSLFPWRWHKSPRFLPVDQYAFISWSIDGLRWPEQISRSSPSSTALELIATIPLILPICLWCVSWELRSALFAWLACNGASC